MPIGALKDDFTNIPAGSKLTVGSILFNMLDLPPEEEAVSTAAAGAGEQLQIQTAGGSSATSNGGAVASAPKSKKPPKGASLGNSGELEGDSFSRIEIRVGRIVKVRWRPTWVQVGPRAC